MNANVETALFSSLLSLLVAAELGANPASAEERICQEASDLEKRLSMLSQCSLASSTGTSMRLPRRRARAPDVVGG